MKTNIYMKETETLIKTVGVFLILAAALLLAGCSNSLDPVNPGNSGGVGVVRVIVEGDSAPSLSARTAFPGLAFTHYTYSFQQGGGTAVAQEPVGGVFTLGIGSGWAVTVYAYATAGADSLAAHGTSAPFTVSAGTNTTDVPVRLTPVVSEGVGTLTVGISYPVGTTLDSFTLTP
jgi:hypothetical protein